MRSLTHTFLLLLVSVHGCKHKEPRTSGLSETSMQSVRLGEGYDFDTGQYKGYACFEVSPEHLDEVVAPSQGVIDIKESAGYEELRKKLGFSLSASFTTQGFDLSGQIKYLRDNATTSLSSQFITYFEAGGGYRGFKLGAKIPLKESAKNELAAMVKKDPNLTLKTAFQKLCGNQLVTRLALKGLFLSTLTIQHANGFDKQQFDAAVKAKVEEFEIKGKIIYDASKNKRNLGMRFDAIQLGGLPSNVSALLGNELSECSTIGKTSTPENQAEQDQKCRLLFKKMAEYLSTLPGQFQTGGRIDPERLQVTEVVSGDADSFLTDADRLQLNITSLSDLNYGRQLEIISIRESLAAKLLYEDIYASRIAALKNAEFTTEEFKQSLKAVQTVIDSRRALVRAAMSPCFNSPLLYSDCLSKYDGLKKSLLNMPIDLEKLVVVSRDFKSYCERFVKGFCLEPQLPENAHATCDGYRQDATANASDPETVLAISKEAVSPTNFEILMYSLFNDSFADSTQNAPFKTLFAVAENQSLRMVPERAATAAPDIKEIQPNELKCEAVNDIFSTQEKVVLRAADFRIPDALLSLPALKVLEIGGADDSFAIDLQLLPLGGLKNLRALTISNVTFPVEELTHLSSLARLKMLSLNGLFKSKLNNMTKAAGSVTNPALMYLDLTDNRTIADLSMVGYLPLLNALNLRNTSVSLDQVKQWAQNGGGPGFFARNTPQLKTIYMNYQACGKVVITEPTALRPITVICEQPNLPQLMQQYGVVLQPR